MLIRGQTTEERIAQIADRFGQGFQNFQQGQNAQRARSLQEEARKRQEAMQALEVSNSIAGQTGKFVDPGQVAPLISRGSFEGLNDILASAPMTRKAEIEAQDRLARQEDRSLNNQIKMAQLEDLSKPYDQTRDYQKAVAIEKVKSQNRPLKENLTFEQKLDLKAKHERENEHLKKPSPDQRKAATFYSRIQQAERDFKKLEEAGYNRASLGESSKAILPNAIKPESLKAQDQAERNFVNAVLRRESGAAIADSEFKSAELQYFPRAGDTPEVLAQKKRNREIVMAGLKAEAGDRAVTEIQKQMGLQEATPQKLEPGIIEDGYQYLGGDPSDPSSWKKAQA